MLLCYHEGAMKMYDDDVLDEDLEYSPFPPALPWADDECQTCPYCDKHNFECMIGGCENMRAYEEEI